MAHSDHKLSDRDPSGLFGTVGAVVAAGLTLLVSFGLPVSEEQQTAILSFVAVAGPLATALAIRVKAYSPATHREEMAELAADITDNPLSPITHPRDI